MGFRSGTECRAELIEVAREMCASMQGVSAVGAVQCVGVSGSAGGYALEVRTTPSSGTATTAQLEVPQIPCDEAERFNDLAELFGLGIVAVLGVFLVREFVYRLVMPQ